MKYHIASGSQISRFRDTGAGTFVTTKDVVFDSADIADVTYYAMDDFPGTPDTSRPKKYTFNLPLAAEPYTYIKVAAHFVRRKKENDNEND